jgi:hypothetical protein
VLVPNLAAEWHMMTYIPLAGITIRTEEVWVCLKGTQKMTMKRSLEGVLLIRLEGFNVLPSVYSHNDSSKTGKGELRDGRRKSWRK